MSMMIKKHKPKKQWVLSEILFKKQHSFSPCVLFIRSIHIQPVDVRGEKPYRPWAILIS